MSRLDRIRRKQAALGLKITKPPAEPPMTPTPPSVTVPQKQPTPMTVTIKSVTISGRLRYFVEVYYHKDNNVYSDSNWDSLSKALNRKLDIYMGRGDPPPRPRPNLKEATL